MPDDKTIEAQHLAKVRRAEQQVRRHYEASIHQVALSFSQVTWDGQTFELKDFPQLSARINQQIKTLHANIYTTTVNSIKESWDFSNLKNNLLVDKRLQGKTPHPIDGALRAKLEKYLLPGF